MKREENYKDDLDYLAQRGFKQVPASAGDFEGLKREIRRRSFSFQRLYLVVAGLVIGVLAGAAFIFWLYEKPAGNNMAPAAVIKTDLVPEKPAAAEKVIALDTVSVEKENFINPSARRTRPLPDKIQHPARTDSADVIVSKPVDLSVLNKGLREEKLKYMINSPVFYLHDMKITNYTTLYFKKNHFVRFTGLPAAYADSSESNAGSSRLKEQAAYYLHEEIAKAMLRFKQGKYDQAIVTLNTVSGYNDNDLNCDFYLAMCYYYKKNFNKAAELFERCLLNSNNTFLQESEFYRAVCLYESGSREEAKTVFRKIAEAAEFYGEKAKPYLNN